MKTIYLGAGCFWGTEAYFLKIRDIKEVESGYANGDTETTTYEKVINGSNHAEVVKLTFDNSKISFDDIFGLYINIIDPYSLNKQGNDIGTNYRTCIYLENDIDMQIFKNILSDWENENGKSQIEIDLIRNYTKAEEYHQKYLIKNKNGYCHINLSNIPKKFKK
ncbi:MAG: peptide-methionine (S)-S-oxide reductase MsrA [Mycoplasma sp.]|nr:peptide-methionine (S)-S-oxide reductase MsrA [Mycoplasma sp.]